MKQIRLADRTRLAYTLDGPPDAPLFVLCDGISCDGYAWKYLRPWLLERGQILHVRYRGHGQSGIPKDPTAVTLPHLARDLDEIMGRLGLPAGIFIGHSMGVQVILEVAYRFPERLRSGLLLCGSGGRVLDTFKETDLGMRILPQLRRLTDKHRDHVARFLRTVMPTELSWQVARFSELQRERILREDFMPYLEHFATMPPDLFLGMLDDAARRTIYPFVDQITQPMLLIAAENDGFTPARVCRQLADALPDCAFHLIADASHTAPVEHPEVFEELIDTFVAERGLLSPAKSAAHPAAEALAVTFRAAG